jgi:hypothetical protein
VGFGALPFEYVMGYLEGGNERLAVFETSCAKRSPERRAGRTHDYEEETRAVALTTTVRE